MNHFLENGDEQWISIPRIIELRQWSVATDLYGIGALFLYTLFHGKDAKNMDRKKTAESDFYRMLKELESVPYFQNMWSYIGPLCTQLALIANKSKTPRQVRDLQIAAECPSFWTFGGRCGPRYERVVPLWK